MPDTQRRLFDAELEFGQPGWPRNPGQAMHPILAVAFESRAMSIIVLDPVQRRQVQRIRQRGFGTVHRVRIDLSHAVHQNHRAVPVEHQVVGVAEPKVVRRTDV
jgi:hypothetical protein